MPRERSSAATSFWNTSPSRWVAAGKSYGTRRRASTRSFSKLSLIFSSGCKVFRGVSPTHGEPRFRRHSRRQRPRPAVVGPGDHQLREPRARGQADDLRQLTIVVVAGHDHVLALAVGAGHEVGERGAVVV